MSGPRLAVRRALRESLGDVDSADLVLVACSGGPDSLALALAAGDEARAHGRRIGAIVIDHGLQDGSADVARQAADTCRRCGLDPVEVVEVSVPQGPGFGGPEAAARDVRRTALAGAAEQWGAVAVLLAHTRDDQAETVLLRLARGSGARALSGMAPVDGLWRRPLLGVDRAVVRQSLGGVATWDDPHNADPRYARARVRAEALPALEQALGDDVVDGLARSARLLRDDADALDALAADVWPSVARIDDAEVSLDVAVLADLPRAVRTRILRRAALGVGVPANDMTLEHVDRMEALVSDWHGQGLVDLPGRIGVQRACGRLTLGNVASFAERRTARPETPEE